MGFIDELGKKVTNAGQKTVQMTKDFSESTKMNVMIGEEEKKIKNAYYEIGKKYASLHKLNYEDSFADLMMIVNESERKIEDYKRQIDAMKSVKRCACGAEITEGMMFCSSCGAPVHNQEQIDGIKCTHCGKTVSKDANFCIHCGMSIEKPQNKDMSSDISEDKLKEQICSNCGSKLSPEAAFCTVCGTRLEMSLETKDEETEDLNYIAESDGEQKEITVPEEKETTVIEPNVVEAENESLLSQEEFVVEQKQEPEEEKMQICPECGAEQPLSSVFCTVCGTKMTKDIEKTYGSVEKTEPAKIILRCKKCGEEVEEDALFCTSCGERLIRQEKNYP